MAKTLIQNPTQLMNHEFITDLVMRGCDNRIQLILTKITNIDHEKMKLIKLIFWLQDMRIIEMINRIAED